MVNGSGSGRVSLALPVYNGERFLREALESVLTQTRPPDEIRVLDNASQDASATIARSLLPDSSVIVRERNVGAIANFSDGVRGSAPNSEFFLWLAADDKLHPQFIERALATLAAEPGLPACLTGIRFIDADGDEIATQTDEDFAAPDACVRLRSFLRRPRWTEFYCLYRRDALLASPIGTDAYGFDVLLIWWFLLRSPYAVTPELLLDYRISGDKEADAVARDLNPHATTVHWRMARMWRDLRDLALAEDVDPAVRRVARRELRLALLHPTWLVHLGADVTLRFPWLRPVGLRVKRVFRRFPAHGPR